VAAGPNRLWTADIAAHGTWEGKVYLAVVFDAFCCRVAGWSIADHLRAELVCDAFDMAVWTGSLRLVPSITPTT
jgi:transposase InsO family protein